MVESSPEWITASDAARICGGVTARSIRRWARAGTFPPPLESPGALFFLADEVARWLLWQSDCAAAKRTGAELPPAPEWKDPHQVAAAALAEKKTTEYRGDAVAT